ncbi:Type III secretion inner membrane protein (YscT,HrcT,SpaR,EscT,EpaR1) [Pseudomonas chlororaphis subsp. piscium]|uniref:type III secretion system export apparatus subunit SctT n=1 Tax=Pseudomonas chlororaphis TaxID=587753 RepID=UPI000F56E551|nr:type III secretion system export apparatus subunit SctT [Pseudomonas chlororaphis]AZC51692.1 Type III secretion inner membrane protein (YscT,HrcT,SpaR,EscT,EpaR1) [Pseudomonas chlororaphis subsp. piscium]
MNTSLFFDLHGWLAGAVICFARLAPIFFMLPFFNSSVLTGAPRNAVIILVGMALWPYTPDTLPPLDTLGFYGLLLQEVGVGMILGCLLSWPFWVFHAMGNLIDNQRGAMLSNTIDPANGDDTSELAKFLQMFAAVFYLEGGGMNLLTETLGRSYQLCSPLLGCELQIEPLIGLLDPLVSKTLIISSPVVATLLLSEALLGLLARFAPQMNAFSVSLTVKGVIALLVLILYFGPHLPDEVLRMATKPDQFANWIVQPEAR